MISRRFAHEEIKLTCHSIHVRLHPSLRAACYLATLHDGFPALFLSIEQVNLATIREVIMQTATDSEEAAKFLTVLNQQPVKNIAAITVAPLLALCAGFFPQQHDQPDTKQKAPKKPTSSKTATWDEIYAEMFATGTGLLGWTPDTTWRATPNEIVLAARGRNRFLSEILKAVFGAPESSDKTVDVYSDEQLAQIEKDKSDPAFDRAAFAALKDSL